MTKSNPPSGTPNVEIAVPFALAPNGGILVTTDPNEQIEQHIQSLVGTGPGERVMLPSYGVPVRDTVFAPDDSVTIASLTHQIEAKIATWEPSVTINGVNVVELPGDPNGSAAIQVDWSSQTVQQPSSTGVLTATIIVGGTVVGTGIPSTS